ncbi:phospholipid-binding lipoprotein MlaA [Sphingomonas sp. NFR04]|uniref:MlaA family lipoprotein n=1 Tax=Sphingomonas sp. NFR04 TaxID=1566283 RepID=UPI0008E30759|nr:VacJ family lipoprotein [Sphingomonas sp. NFR04]SFK36839.1 phospholipid-binding lipoprotein MlaA [Sphingomonas sp. NFR04]
MAAMLLMSGPAAADAAGTPDELIAVPIVSVVVPAPDAESTFPPGQDTVAPTPPAAQATPPAVQATAPAPEATPPVPQAASGPTEQAQPETAQDDEIVVSARPRPPREDPLQEINLKTYAVVQTADKVIVAPAAKAYSKILPSFFRAGLRHFFNNLNEPIVFVNYLLQHKIGKAFETVGRFGVNSTLGVAGVVDVAKKAPFKLPKRRNSFANTLGFYGVKSGPFLFLPLVGPTTVRDLVGLSVDKLLLPSTVGKPFNRVWYTLPATIIGTLDDRVEFADKLQSFRDSPDPYAASRASYLRSRQAEIDALHVHGHRRRKPEVQPDTPAPPPPPEGAK